MSINLSDDDRDDLADLIWNFSNGVHPSDDFIDALVAFDENIIQEGLEWGFDDTVVRQKIMDNFSRILLGVGYPTNAHKWTEEKAERFEENLNSAYEKWHRQRNL